MESTNKEYYKDLCMTLDKVLLGYKKPVLYLEAGYYDPRVGVDDFALSSMSEAIKVGEDLIKRYGHKVRLVFGVLVNDLGLDADELKENTMPKSLEEVMAGSNIIKRDRVLIWSEKTAKNRSIKNLKQIIGLKSNNRLILREDDYEVSVLMRSDNGNNVLLAQHSNNVFKARCPSIMGKHYSDCLELIKKRFPEMTYFIVMDWSKILDRDKVTAGSQTYLNLFASAHDNFPISIINVFYIDDVGHVCDFDQSHNTQQL